jgi:hypothetical protein
MSGTQDKLNYIKNMIWMMCCDGEIAEREKQFLSRAAKEIDLKVDNWNALLKEVSAEGPKIYPISSINKAIATLKSLVVMAKADRKIDEREKEYMLRFAKSIGISNEQWKQLSKDIDLKTLLDPFKEPKEESKQTKTGGTIVVLKEDFDKLNEFEKVAKEKDITMHVTGFDEFIAGAGGEGDVICFHASEDKDESVRKCKQLLKKSPDKTAGILTRYQGHQVKYMLEEGLKKCIIEPIYSQDIDKLLG